VIFSAFYRKKGFTYLLQGSRLLRQVVIENYKAARHLLKHDLSHIGDLPQRVTNLDSRSSVEMVYLDGDRLYTELNGALHVYLINDLTLPIATYRLNGHS
jgi:hypothetical protein